MLLKSTSCILFAMLLLIDPSNARGDLIHFVMEWDGSSFGNSAMATGSVTMDTDQLNNPGTDGTVPFGSFGFSNMVIEVSGASSGNGTFTSAPGGGLPFFTWTSTAPGVDVTMELVGQPEFAPESRRLRCRRWGLKLNAGPAVTR